ncbi:MAG: M23 family metallopeptidase [Flavobacteriaceae bacterium]|nr:M23 family metallopeptidase [Flavobacteriaceae bacterium]
MKKQYILALLLTVTSLAFSQSKKYPTSYFRKPLDIPLVLAGTFGELRGNHFHSGIDIKTQGRSGLKVRASANGYVARIKVSHWGYGKALYIKHPNGYTTVYAHLKKFSPKIEKYVKQQQYKKQSFEIQLFPNNKQLRVKKGEMIAYSGNTGGSTAPHLHYEIRNSKTEKTINPLLFGFKIADHKKPQITSLRAYPLTEDSQVNQSGVPLQLSIHRTSDGDLMADKITACGKIGFAIGTFDRLDDAPNKNGIYRLVQKVNGAKTHQFTAQKFSFNETRYINLLIDYQRYKEIKQRVQKCYIEPSNKLKMYTTIGGDGTITVEDGNNYTTIIEVSDIEGNKTKLTIPIQGKKEPILIQKEPKITPYYIDYKTFNKFEKNGVTVAFPKQTFYESLYLDFQVNDNVAKIHDETVPLHKNYTLTFDISHLSKKQKKHLYIARLNSKEYKSFVRTIKKKDKCYTTTKYLGNYTLAYDSIPPKIRLYKSHNKQWLTRFSKLRVKISDKGTGIKKYRGQIDGKWILMEYDPKRGILIYDFNDKKFQKAKHTLKVVVMDNVGNTSTFVSTFYRKK